MFTARPPAKVNLTLEVLGRRPDGYHELRSVFLRIGLTDSLSMRLLDGPAPDRLTVTGLPGAPAQGNLVLAALDLLRALTGVDLPALDVTLDKRIPVAAGLGGGSSDAAAALHLAQATWAAHIASSSELAAAEALGSDVPFFYFDMAAASVGGRGEQLSPLAAPNLDLGLLTATPSVRLRTSTVFARYDDLKTTQRHITEPSGRALDALDDIFKDEPTGDQVVAWAERHRDANDLWPAAVSLEPSLADLRAALERATARAWRMSGSGSTLFALYASAAEAADAGRRLVLAESVAVSGTVLNAVDLVGPEPAWRYP